MASKKIKTRKTDVYPSKSFYEGRTNLNKLGAPIGNYYKKEGKRTKWQILNAGMIQVGINNHVLGLCPGRCEIFIGRNGKLWRYPNALLPSPVQDVLGLDREDLVAWADAGARAVIDRLSPRNESKVSEKSNYRYRKIVHALVNQRILDAAAIGYECTALSYARGISTEWTDHDLLYPRHATIRHATLVALVLALEADKAAQLIELAALIEMRIPFVSREAALAIYQQAVSLLARLCPQWWNQGYTCRWEMVGDIDRIFRAQYIRMLEDAFDNNTQFETAGGLVLRNMLASEPDVRE
tara:strand:+ start:24587 stop:25477 length:891 start_codon:yes stop_codon:yes gene_type:complete